MEEASVSKYFLPYFMVGGHEEVGVAGSRRCYSTAVTRRDEMWVRTLRRCTGEDLELELDGGSGLLFKAERVLERRQHSVAELTRSTLQVEKSFHFRTSKSFSDHFLLFLQLLQSNA